MNTQLHDLLSARADAVPPPHLDPLAVVARGERLVRRRRGVRAAGAAAALCAIAAAVLTLDLDDAGPPEPANPDRTIGKVERPLVYGQGQTLHLDGDTVDIGFDFLSLDVTDEGAAITAFDGGIWFTDGTEVVQVGDVPGGKVAGAGVGWSHGRPGDWVVADSRGSLLAWVEYADRGRRLPELVVYDSSLRDVVARRPIDNRGRENSAIAIAGRNIFVQVSGLMLRYNVDSVAVERADAVDLRSARDSIPRALVVGSSAGAGALVHSDGDYPISGFEGWFDVRDSRLDGVFDPHTGMPLDIEVPDGYETTRLVFIQWLGDDQFVLASGGAPQGDLLVCQIAEGRCRLLIEESSWTQTPLLPGFGAFGYELAVIEALRQDVE